MITSLDNRVKELVEDEVATKTNITALKKFISAENLSSQLGKMEVGPFSADQFSKRYQHIGGELQGMDETKNALAYLAWLAASKQNIVEGSNAHLALIAIADTVAGQAQKRYAELQAKSAELDKGLASEWQELTDLIKATGN